MNIQIETKTKMTIETIAYLHEGKLKTYPCELNAWWGEDICEEVNLNSEIEKT